MTVATKARNPATLGLLSMLLVLLLSLGASAQDLDSDGVPDSIDNCVHTPNPDQLDRGRLGSRIADGIGDACQCGDVNGDGMVHLNDSIILRRALAGRGPGIRSPELCNVRGPTNAALLGRGGLTVDCEVIDAVIIERAIVGFAPGLLSVCDAAVVAGGDVTPPVLLLDAPGDGEITSAGSINVRGTVDDDTATVTANGIALPVAGGVFEGPVPLAEGQNLLTVVATDPAGNFASLQVNVLRDSIGPQLEVSAPLDGSALEATQVLVRGTASDPRGISSLTVSGVNASFTGDAFLVTVPLVPGGNLLSVRAADSLGNLTSIELVITRISAADAEGPLIQVTQPAEGDVVADPTVTLVGRLIDASEVEELRVNGAPVPLLGERFSTPVALVEGANQILLIATDVFENEAQVLLNLTLDTTVPAAPVLQPVVSPTRADRATLSGQAEAGALVQATGGAGSVSTPAGSDGSFSLTVFLLLNQENRLLLTAEDGVGNVGPALPLSIVQDGIAPDVEIRSPRPAATLSEGIQPVLVAAGDSAGLESVTVNGVTASDVGGGLFRASLSLEAGAITLDALALDLAGNAATAFVSLEVVAADPNLAPVVHIALPAPGAVGTSPLTVTGTVFSSNPLSQVLVTGASAEVASVVDGVFEASVFLNPSSSTPIEVRATDSLGNIGTDLVVVTLDSAAPGAPLVQPLASPTRSEAVIVRGTSDPGASVRITGGLLPATGSTDPAGAFNVQVQLRRDVLNDLDVVALDAVGNVSPPSVVSVRQDGTAPLVEATTPLVGATEVAAGTEILVDFNETLAAGSLGGVDLQLDGVSVAATVSIEGDGSLLRIAPGIPFPTDSAVRLEISGVTDVAGNDLEAPFVLSFSTTDSVAPAPPTLVPQPPALTRDTRVLLTGTAELGGQIEIAGGSSPSSGPVAPDGSFAVQVGLTSNALNVLSVVVRDPAGNASQPAFATVTQDGSPPGVILSPAPGSQGVETLAELSATFDEAVALDSLEGRLVLRRGGQTQPSSTVLSAAGESLQLLPDQPLVPGEIYTLALLAGVRDRVGNATTEEISSSFTVGGLAFVAVPIVEAVNPPSPTTAVSVTVSGTADPGLFVSLEGPAGSAEVAVGGTGAWAASVPLALDRIQAIAIRARDDLGNLSETLSLVIEQDATRPSIVGVQPASGAPASIRTAISISFSEPLDPATLPGNVVVLRGADPVAGLLSFSQQGRVLVFNPDLTLEPAQSYVVQISVGLRDRAGNALAAPLAHAFTTAADPRRPDPPLLDAVASPTAAVAIPLAGRGVEGDEILVTGGSGAPQTIIGTDGTFSVLVPLLIDRSQVLIVTARNPANGESAASSVQVIQDSSPPLLSVGAPAEGAMLADDTATVTGRVQDASGIAELTVAGQPTVVGAGSFVASVALVEGANQIRIAATDRAGNRAEIVRSVVHAPLDPNAPDLDPPVIQIDSPTEGATVPATVLVVGTVNDASSIVDLRVQGQPVLADARGLFSLELPLGPLETSITVRAVDRADNVATVVRAIVLDDTAPIVLVDPLPASTTELSLALSGATEPGAIVEVAGAAASVPAFASLTDGSFTLDLVLRAEARNLLLVTATDGVGNRSLPVDVTILHDSAGPRVLAIEPPDQASDVSPGTLVQVTFSEPIDPIALGPTSLTVVDRAGTVPGSVSQSPGGGILTFVPNEPFSSGDEVVVSVSGLLTDLRGLAIGADLTSSFTIAAAPTGVRGLVIGADGAPLEGVGISIEGTNIAGATGAQGNFRLSGVPPGEQVLRVDGSTAASRQSFSLVTRDLQVIPGETNLLPRPIILTPINQGSAVFLEGDREQTLAFGGDLEGLLLEVPARSATFPDGTASGHVTATIIDPSHIPGRLPDDSVPALLVSLEPGGTTFDPPCRVEFPNQTDLPPGTTVTIFSFEGAVSQFDTLCAGVVTDDGTRVVSTEECVSHFSFIGFVPDITGDFESASEAEAFLSGRVVDALGNGIPGVLVDVAASESRVETDAEGRYFVPLPRRNFFALRVFATVPTSLSTATGEEQFAVFQSEPVDPAAAGTTEVPDIIVDRIFLSGDVSLVSANGTVGIASQTSYGPDGELVEISLGEAGALRVWILSVGRDGRFDPDPLTAVTAEAAPLGPFAVGRYLVTLAGSMQEGESPGALGPGDLVRIVGHSPTTGYTGWTDLRLPSLADLGGADLRVDLQLRPPQTALELRRVILDASGERVEEVVQHEGRVSNADQLLQLTTRFRVDGQAPPAISGLSLRGRFATASNLGERDVRFNVPAGETARLIELRAAFPDPFDPIEAGRILRSGFIEVASLANFAPERRLAIGAIGSPSVEPVERFEFDVISISATPPDESGNSTIVSTQDTARPGSPVDVLNTRTSLSASGLADPDGALQLAIPAQVGDILKVLFTDVAGQPEVALVPVPQALASLADDPIVRILVNPDRRTLRAVFDRFDLSVIGMTASGAGVRLGVSDGLSFISASPDVVTVDERGRVTARGEGETTIEVQLDALTVRSAVTVALPPEPTFVLTDVFADYGAEIGTATGIARPGDEIVIEGIGFLADPFAHTVIIGGVEAVVIGGDERQIRVRVPGGALTGRVRILAGEDFSDELLLQITDGPIITRLEPILAHVGDTVAVRGVNFGATIAENTVLLRETELDDFPALVVSVGPDRIDFVVPDLAESPRLRVVVGAKESDEFPLTIMVPVTMNIILPPALAGVLNVEDLTVEVGVHSQVKPTPAGTAEIDLAVGLATMITLRDPNDHIIFYAVGHPAEPLSHEVSALSTAAYHLFLSAGLIGFPPNFFRTIVEQLYTMPESDALAAEIVAGLVADLNFLAGPSQIPGFMQAFEAALGRLVGLVQEAIAAAPSGDAALLQRRKSLLARAFELLTPEANAALPEFVRKSLAELGCDLVIRDGDRIPENLPEEVSPRDCQSFLIVTAAKSDAVTVNNGIFRWVSAQVRDLSADESDPLVTPHLSLLSVLQGEDNLIGPASKFPTIPGLKDIILKLGDAAVFEKAIEFAIDGPSLTAPAEIKPSTKSGPPTAREFDINSGPYELELIGPSSGAGLKAITGLIGPFDLVSSELETRIQIEAYALTTGATFVTEVIGPVLEFVLGSEIGGKNIFGLDKQQKATVKELQKFLKTVKEVAEVAGTEGKLIIQVGVAFQNYFTSLDQVELLRELFRIAREEIDLARDRVREEFGELDERIAAQHVEEELLNIQRELEGLVTKLMKDATKKASDAAAKAVADRVVLLVPGLNVIAALREVANIGISAANIALTKVGLLLAEELVRFEFQITESLYDRIEPEVVDVDELDDGFFEVQIFGSFFPKQTSWIDGRALGLDPDQPFALCKDRFGPCRSVLDQQVPNKNYVAFQARSGQRVPGATIVLGTVLEVVSLQDPNTSGTRGLSKLIVRVPRDAFTGPLVIQSKGKKQEALFFTVEVPDEPGLSAYVTNREGPDRFGPGTITIAKFAADGSAFLGVTGTIEFGAKIPWAIVPHPNGQRAFISDWKGGKVFQLDLRTREIVGEPLVVGPTPNDIAISPSGRHLLVVLATREVVVVDTRTMKEVKRIQIPVPDEYWGRSIDVSPDGKRAYALFVQRRSGGELLGQVAVIDIGGAGPASPELFQVVGDPVLIENMDEPSAIRVQNNARAWVVAKGTRSDNIATVYDTHFDIARYDIGSFPEFKNQFGFFDVPLAESETHTSGRKYPPSPFANVDLFTLAPSDIGFSHPRTSLAYVPLFESGNVAVVDTDSDFTVAATRSDYGIEEVFEIQNVIQGLTTAVFDPFGFGFARLAQVLIQAQVKKTVITNALTLPRRIDFSQNYDFALVTRIRGSTLPPTLPNPGDPPVPAPPQLGDLLVLRDQAMFDAIAHSYANPNDENDLSDLAPECIVFHENLGDTAPFNAFCDVRDYAYALPGRGVEDLEVPVFEAPRVGKRAEDVMIERIVGIVKPEWGSCVKGSFELRVHAASVVSQVDYGFGQPDTSPEGHVSGEFTIGFIQGNLEGDPNTGFTTVVDIGPDDPNGSGFVPDDEYLFEVRGVVPDASPAFTAMPLFVDRGAPALLGTIPLDRSCVSGPFTLEAAFDPGGFVDAACNRIRECQLFIDNQRIATHTNPEDDVCIFEGLDPVRFGKSLKIRLEATDVAGNAVSEQILLFQPKVLINAPSQADPGTSVTVGVTATPPDGTLQFFATGDTIGTIVLDPGTIKGDKLIGSFAVTGPETPGTVTLRAVVDGAEPECHAEEELTLRFPGCSDGIVQIGEECDDGNLVNDDGCSAECLIEELCLNGRIDEGEDCDDGGNSLACDEDCTFSECGDGFFNEFAREECDDEVETEFCNADCTLARCGDQKINVTAGEECDDLRETPTCDEDCTFPECGDGLHNFLAGEECDEGGVQTANCEVDCRIPRCGDVVRNQLAGEDCDLGPEDTGLCDFDCSSAVCGDGYRNRAAGEDCDTGGRETPTCDTDCTDPLCGDGLINRSRLEFCDDGGESATCDVDCTAAICGDTRVNLTAGELCDDGEESATCDVDCTPAECGDGILNVTAGELCDDANLEVGDGCDASCQIEL